MSEDTRGNQTHGWDDKKKDNKCIINIFCNDKKHDDKCNKCNEEKDW